MSTALTTYLQHVKSLSGPQRLSLAAVTIPILYTLLRTATTNRRQRQRKVPPTSERVLILGASSGVGQQIAHLYAHRGARVCVVGRRKDKVDEVVQECRVMSQGSAKVEVLGVTGDFAKAEDMVKIREALEQAWGGLDTVIVSAGVSALQPLMAVAGLERQDKLTFSPAEASKDAIQRATDIATAATVGNYIGPLVSAVALIPLLQRTSASPSILLISTLAAVMPPPTRSLYGSTKAAALTLYQALAIEHPAIRFSYILPYTIEGDFRAGAVDKGPVREADPNKKGSGALSKLEVAQRCIQAVDNKDGVVFMPGWMRLGQFMYWIWPSFVENRARIKYNFH